MTLRPGFDPEIIDTDVSCRVALLTGDQDQGRKGKRSRRGSTSGSRRGGSVGGSIVSTAPSQGGRAPTSSTTHIPKLGVPLVCPSIPSLLFSSQ